MNETPADVDALQRLLDRSYARAGEHLLSIHTPDRRLTAEQVIERLSGVCVLALATVTADGRPIAGPVDGLFHRGAFWFGSSPDSVRFTHIRQRPDVSAVHTRGEEFAVSVHGTAVVSNLRAEPGLAAYCAEIYHPLFGEEWSEWAADLPYARIDARAMYVFAMD